MVNIQNPVFQIDIFNRKTTIFLNSNTSVEKYIYHFIIFDVYIIVMTELYARENLTGYAAYERIDGKLIRPEAIQLLKIK